MRKTIGNLIRRAREKKGLTREEAAKKIGISPRYFGFLEGDRYAHISPKTLKSMQHKIGLTNRLGNLVEKNNNRARLKNAGYRKTSLKRA